MARSARIHPERKAEVLQSLERNGFLTQGALAGHLEMALSTVNNFINSKRVYISKFEEICDALGLEPQDLIQGRGEAKKPSSQVKETLPINFAAYDDCWVGREQLTQQLKNRLLNSSRLLIILGLTGIGKTALAERISLETEEWFDKDWQQGFLRVSFEAAQQNKDFATVARQWLEKLQVNISPQECHPEQLLLKISDYLQQQRVLVLIDSLENLLTGNEQEGWGSFQDSFWQRFFLSILTAPSCQSRIIITSQELPTQLVQQRYQQLWHCQVLQGLTEEEQKALIEIMGFDISSTSKDKPLLLRLGRAY
ncbi:MAG: NACHT domain-containing protein, partial [Spirulinaceae cyanobacterium]